MASSVASDVDASATEKSYPKDYKLFIHLCADPGTYDYKKDWMLAMAFHCHDLLRIMRGGLFWTTSNVLPDRGWLDRTRGTNAAYHPWQRVWELREAADKPDTQCRWVATATLYAHSVKLLSEFRLRTLQRQNVTTAWADNKAQHRVFLYNRIPGAENFNCFVDGLHPLHGSWWLWPMETILDYDTLASGPETETETETASLI